MVSTIIHGSQWAFPINQTFKLNEVRNSLPHLPISGDSPVDNIVWTLSSNGKFTISSLWDNLKSQFPKVPWNHIVWFPGHIPKCSIITCITILNRLFSEDRLVMFGIKPSFCCFLCTDVESHDHLFF